MYRLVCVVHHLVSSRKPFCTGWFDSNYDIHSAIRLIGIDPSHTVHLQGPPRQFTPLHHLVCNFSENTVLRYVYLQ